jgi:hypothetical protein
LSIHVQARFWHACLQAKASRYEHLWIKLNSTSHFAGHINMKEDMNEHHPQQQDEALDLLIASIVNESLKNNTEILICCVESRGAQ